MPQDRFISNWQDCIIAEAEKKLARKLTELERRFITARSGCVALEMIHDTIKTSSAQEISKYLNSEASFK